MRGRSPNGICRLLAWLLLPASGAAWADSGEDADCRPPIAPKLPHYVIGYGSLMETASKDRTWEGTGMNLPVRLRGYERSWTARSTAIGFSTTFLAAAPKEGAEMVAALDRVFDPASFTAGDAREAYYCRAEVEPGRITPLDGSGLPNRGRFWIYLLKPESRHPADGRFPIVQSYVDIFLNGCLELADLVVAADLDFAAACVTTTAGWSRHWVNDRVHPRRPYDVPNALRIDRLLQRLLPQQFEAIRIE